MKDEKRTDDVSSPRLLSAVAKIRANTGPSREFSLFFLFFLLCTHFNDLKMKQDRKNLANVLLHQIDLVPSCPP